MVTKKQQIVDNANARGVEKMMMSVDFGKDGERRVKCPSCEEFSKVKNWQLFGKHGQYFYCPKCKAALTKKEFLSLPSGVLAFGKQLIPEKNTAKECPCKRCELDCNANIGTVNCALEGKSDG